MRLIEISSFKLFCCKLDSHKMFCCKKFCHKNVVRKAKKNFAQGFPCTGKKKIEGGARQVAMPRTSSSYEEVGGVATCCAATPYGHGRGCGRAPVCGRRQARLCPRLFCFFFCFFFKLFFLLFLCLCLFFCVFCLPCFGLAMFLSFFKKNLLFRFCAIAFKFFLKFSSHALVLIFVSFFSFCCLVSVLLFFEERSSSDSNPP